MKSRKGEKLLLLTDFANSVQPNRPKFKHNHSLDGSEVFTDQCNSYHQHDLYDQTFLRTT